MKIKYNYFFSIHIWNETEFRINQDLKGRIQQGTSGAW